MTTIDYPVCNTVVNDEWYHTDGTDGLNTLGKGLGGTVGVMITLPSCLLFACLVLIVFLSAGQINAGVVIVSLSCLLSCSSLIFNLYTMYEAKQEMNIAMKEGRPCKKDSQILM